MKYLPKTAKNIQGFTLIELLVVIAIIAILAVTGFAVFSGLTTRGNDSRRQTDIKAISDVFEVKRGTATSYGALALSGNDFSGGSIPTDPVSTRNYCIASTTGASAVSNATVSASDGITAAGVCVGSNWAAVSTTALPASTTFFKVCVLLQDNTTVKCVGSKQ